MSHFKAFLNEWNLPKDIPSRLHIHVKSFTTNKPARNNGFDLVSVNWTDPLEIASWLLMMNGCPRHRPDYFNVIFSRGINGNSNNLLTNLYNKYHYHILKHQLNCSYPRINRTIFPSITTSRTFMIQVHKVSHKKEMLKAYVNTYYLKIECQCVVTKLTSAYLLSTTFFLTTFAFYI